MNIEKELHKRSGSTCELSGDTENLHVYQVPKSPNSEIDSYILISKTCMEQIEGTTEMDPNHWRCLNDSIWSEITAVKVIAWRMLNRLLSYGWPQDLLNMLYLDDKALEWAKATRDDMADEDTIKHIDAHGAVLSTGDPVVLIKDLVVKGANFTAKRGTSVRNISLVHDHPEQIEGRVNGQHIVILTKFVKKS